MNIKKLNSFATQKICASQVIVSLADAVKELLENSLDANSNKIEINLKNFGADLIEVQDNGSGVSISDFAEIMKSHSTSKIKEFKDLSNLDTFGFRGEALNSLCTLSDVTIHTCTESSTVGTIVTYDYTGNVSTQTSLARSIGTTVCARNIFNSLPVRRRQLLSNLRREYEKVVCNVTSFCLISVGTQISCYRLDGSKNLVVTNGCARSIRNNIEAVFGSAQMKALIDIKVDRNVGHEIVAEFAIRDKEYLKRINIDGCISKPAEGCGRSSSDRQFLFINGRPSDATKISRLVCACYKEMNLHQLPVFVLSISLPQDSVDVNIEPNKRAVFFDHLPDVLAVVKASILLSFAEYGCSEDTRLMNTSLTQSLLGASIRSPCQSPSQAKRGPSPIKTSTPKRTKVSDHTSLSSPIVSRRHTLRTKSTCQRISAHFSIAALSTVPYHPPSVTNDGESTSGAYSATLDSSDNMKAEEELRRIFKKSQFLELEVLGQFNLGFIVARTGHDLFIVDQHASDERSRFEYFLAECRMGSQPLVRPVTLALGSGQEQLILDNMAVFERCGFRFEVTESGVQMTAVCSRNGLVLGVSDVLEMVHVVRETATTSVMPGRIRAAVASNACRSAIMIGKCLSSEEMSQVLAKMALLKNPWVCAHDRPIMRHLCSLARL